MNTNIEEIRKLIASKESAIEQEQNELYKLKTEYGEAVKRKFTEDTGISEGDKFECTITNKDFKGNERTSKYYGFLVGFRLSEWGSVLLVYADVKKDGSRSKNTHNTIIEIKNFCNYEKI